MQPAGFLFASFSFARAKEKDGVTFFRTKEKEKERLSPQAKSKRRSNFLPAQKVKEEVTLKELVSKSTRRQVNKKASQREKRGSKGGENSLPNQSSSSVE